MLEKVKAMEGSQASRGRVKEVIRWHDTFAAHNVELLVFVLLRPLISEMLCNQGKDHLLMASGENKAAKGSFVIFIWVIVLIDVTSAARIVHICKVSQIQLCYIHC